MKPLFFLLFLLLFLQYSLPLHAYDIEGQFRTFFSASETKDNKNSFPFFEYINLNISNDKNTSFLFGGWMKYDLADKIYDKRFDSELSYAYVSMPIENITTTINLGRIPVYESTTYELIDGIQIKKHFNTGFKISAYLGSPTGSDFNSRSGDSILGGKISYLYKDLINLGVSYLNEKNDSMNYREEAAIDLWIHPVYKTELYGKSSYNLENQGWISHDYIISVKPTNQVKIDLLYSWYSYDRYFTPATSSAFLIQQGNLNPNEEILITGINGEFQSKDIIYALDFKNFNYKIADTSYYYGGNIIYKYLKPFSFSISLHRMEGSEEKLRYYELKSFLSKEFTKKLSGYVSFIDIIYDEKVNNIKNSYNVSASSQFKFNQKAKTSLNIEYSHNPDFHKEVKMFFKFIYNLGAI